MTVRKKIKTSRDGNDKIDLSQELKTVREKIQTLTEEDNMQNETPATPETPSAPKPKSTVKRKAAPKKKATTVKKKAKSAGNGAVKKDMVSLAQLCKAKKVNPRAARRKLREAGVKNPGRWSWPKGAVPKSVENALSQK